MTLAPNESRSATGADRSVHAHVADGLAEIKPTLRGWLHAVTAPLAFFLFLVMLVLADDTRVRLGVAVFMTSALLLFGTSAIYHTGTWSPKTWAFLRRFDHSNIFVLIAGSYTAFSLLLLDGTAEVALLTTVWAGAVLGVLFRIFWTDAPRWLYVPLYIAMGWAALFFIPAFFDGATALGLGVGIAVLVLIAAGGALYTLGGVVYGFKRPNPWPKYFGFHEVFHTFTVLAFATHYVGVSLATYNLR